MTDFLVAYSWGIEPKWTNAQAGARYTSWGEQGSASVGMGPEMPAWE